MLNTEEKELNDHALNLKFTIGLSSNMIGAVHNLTIGDKKVLINIILLLGNISSCCSYWNNIQL
jgi:hypothetical protein